jgi:protease I
MCCKIFRLILSLSLVLFVGLSCGAKQQESEQKSEVTTEEQQKEVSSDMSTKNILMIIAHNNFRDEELFEPKELFENAGASVTVASSEMTEATGMKGGTITPDSLISDVNVDVYDAVVFIGGSGSKEYWNDATAHQIAKTAYDDGKIVAAICLAPVTLANAGLLEGKNATVFQSAKDKLNGANYTGNPVEVDGRIITGNGPKAATDFGKKILEKL